MDTSFQERAARIAEKEPEAHQLRSERPSRAGFWIFGAIFGFCGALLVRYANENYETTPEFEPVALAVVVFLLITAVALVLGILLLLFRRRALIVFFLAEVLGFAFGGVVNVFAKLA